MKKRAKRPEGAASAKTYLVFISHATYDKWVAKVICKELESPNVGVKTFRDDKDIAGGDKIPDEIQRGIRECNELVILLTPESISRQWVLVEIGIAIGLKRRIVPLLYHVSPKQIPEILHGTKAYSLDEFDDYIAEVAKRSRQP